MSKNKKKKASDTPLASLALYEHDSPEDVVDRIGELLGELGYELHEVDVDEDEDEADLYGKFVVTHVQEGD